MASILDKYGIKEVADVTFYKINDDGTAGAPVLYLDTLKVSTIEQTAEETSAKGGKGNPPLITWDYGKEINVTLEDALFSAKSMAILFGSGDVSALTSASDTITKTIAWTKTSTNSEPNTFTGPQGKVYTLPSATTKVTYDATGSSTTSFTEGEVYYTVVNIPISGAEIDVSGDSFPGTYYITGDTYARSEKTGVDEFFQFIIPKAKILSQNTITMQAEGDPSVFNLNLKVLRPSSGAMMKLVKYDIALGTEE